MSHRFVWSIVAVLSLGGLIAFLSQSSAQRAGGGAPGGMPGMAGMPQGMPGRFVVANASSSQVLILDTATGQVYRAKEEDFKKMSDLPGMGQPGGGRDIRPGGRDRQPEPKEANPRERRNPDNEAPKDKDARPRDRRDPPKDAPRPAPQGDAPPRRQE